ncbi:hypothetical protein H310_05072 [Aphanomyces invadans]|uniref:HSF-type DNA-binding domain-containing protein n=1 Tax=Aphanomyces invadans TaxID=157072 RepID=A0A024UB91_9STRA|nr:hypothetical protein H310_05072 [Aphanomyces invadans]ETW03686.1 hypothetical protein H310_05072 [Aphanomyces invadans]|eukprot:XP_008867915.1 hypothetical protein H310_05072 [Aphanomyces invadans]
MTTAPCPDLKHHPLATTMDAPRPPIHQSHHQQHFNVHNQLHGSPDESDESSSASPLKEVKHRKVGVPKFLRYLFQILECEDPHIISWSVDGTSIQILDMVSIANDILPKYFKHSNYASFQRQLNYFGFRKWTKSQTTICTFSHPEFLRHRPDRMSRIKRKNRPERMGTRQTGPPKTHVSNPSFPTPSTWSDMSTPTSMAGAVEPPSAPRHASFPSIDIKTMPSPHMLPAGLHQGRGFGHYQDIPPLHSATMTHMMEQVNFMGTTPLHHYRGAPFDQNNSRQHNQVPPPADAAPMWYYYPA